MISNTCKKEECAWWKEHKESCPMYITTVWNNSDEPGATKIIEDCAPKRNSLLLMEYSSRAVGIQQDYEEQRNKYDKLIKDMSLVILMLKQNQKTDYITHKEE